MNPKQINYIRQQHAKYPAQYMIGETVPKSQEQIRIEGIFPEAFETKAERKRLVFAIEIDIQRSVDAKEIQRTLTSNESFLSSANITVTELKPERECMTLDIEWDKSDDIWNELKAVDFRNAIVSVYKDRNIIIRV